MRRADLDLSFSFSFVVRTLAYTVDSRSLILIYFTVPYKLATKLLSLHYIYIIFIEVYSIIEIKTTTSSYSYIYIY